MFAFQFIIDSGVLPHLYNLLTQNHKKSIKKEACWTISNITAGNKVQIEVCGFFCYIEYVKKSVFHGR